MADLMAKVYKANNWSFVDAIKRKEKQHLKGHNFTSSPTFTWPPYLQRLKKKDLSHLIPEHIYEKHRAKTKE